MPTRGRATTRVFGANLRHLSHALSAGGRPGEGRLGPRRASAAPFPSPRAGPPLGRGSPPPSSPAGPGSPEGRWGPRRAELERAAQGQGSGASAQGSPCLWPDKARRAPLASPQRRSPHLGPRSPPPACPRPRPSGEGLPGPRTDTFSPHTVLTRVLSRRAPHQRFSLSLPSLYNKNKNILR